MRLKIEQDDMIQDVEIIIKCKTIDDKLKNIIETINRSYFFLSVSKEGVYRQLSPQKIFYIESVDEKTFVYCSDEVYDCNKKLYELEDELTKLSFVRISKSCILNVDSLDSVRPLINGKMEALLLNGERLVINRHYVRDFKRKFGI